MNDIKPDELRYKDFERVKEVIRGDLNGSLYYAKYSMFNDAQNGINEANRRIDTFVFDINHDKLNITSFLIDYLRINAKSVEKRVVRIKKFIGKK
ncbi:hypothetical protein HYV50_05035 [Candidatus Pacearchaeota archaeon]|nr:hypothetical protein [Candidatus Pacearchaeota archaeon]